MNEKNICCICGKPFAGFGNNPEPVKPFTDENGKEQKACNNCNWDIVIPARIMNMKKRNTPPGYKIAEYKEDTGELINI